jgi:hypothetical protein
VSGDRLAQREHDRHRFGQQPSRDESECLPGDGVEPVRIVYQAQERALLGDRAEQAEHGHGDQEPVRGVAGRHAQGDAQRVPLRLWKHVESVEHRRAQPMDSGERQLHLRLDARDLRDAQARRLPRRIPQQRRLPDPRFATDDQDGALARAHVGEHPVEELTLACPSQETQPMHGGHLAAL